MNLGLAIRRIAAQHSPAGASGKELDLGQGIIECFEGAAFHRLHRQQRLASRMNPEFAGRFFRDMPHGPAEQVSQQPGCCTGFWRNVDVHGGIPSVKIRRNRA
ncbi:hypothetical protein [Bosea psychrotolerans]|uniref:hypothetical protein n=1 Tax=Bosea psychrotolerans TaxID=1871628 RepID=UPI001AECC886|nr:hypothetical protein [Bosea psychrotolerans]